MKEITRSIFVTAEIENVFAAIANQHALRAWLSETACLEPSPGGRLTLGGPRLHSNPVPTESSALVTEIEPPRRLGFEWAYLGTRSNVVFDVSETKGGVTVRLTHRTDRDQEDERILSVDRLTIWLHNLRRYVEVGEPSCLPDHSQAGDAMVASIHIVASGEEIFRALTDPNVLNQWVANRATVELQAGGVYSYGWTRIKDGMEVPAGPERILDLVPGETVVTDWNYLDCPMQVRWRVEAADEGCTLTITHSGFGDNPFQLSDHIDGWVAYLCELKALLEGKTPAQL